MPMMGFQPVCALPYFLKPPRKKYGHATPNRLGFMSLGCPRLQLAQKSQSLCFSQCLGLGFLGGETDQAR